MTSPRYCQKCRNKMVSRPAPEQIAKTVRELTGQKVVVQHLCPYCYPNKVLSFVKGEHPIKGEWKWNRNTQQHNTTGAPAKEHHKQKNTTNQTQTNTDHTGIQHETNQRRTNTRSTPIHRRTPIPHTSYTPKNRERRNIHLQRLNQWTQDMQTTT